MSDIAVDKFISKTNIILNNTSNNAWHILLCFDNNYALPSGMSILSIIKNNADKSIHFHLFTRNLSIDNRRKFSQIVGDNISITEYIVNDEFTIAENNILQFPISACLRLIAPSLLKNVADKLLYVDSDTLCLGDLTALFDSNIENEIVAAVRDVSRMQHSQCEKMNIAYGTYFNAGVILFNTANWYKQSLTEKTLSLLNGNIKYSHPDQDVMNIVVQGKRLLLDKKYNYFVALSSGGNDDAKVNADIKIIHYVSKNKPWHIPYRTRLFDSYLINSPWKDDILPLYESRKISSSRQFSRLMFKQGHYFLAIKHYMIYLKRKIVDKK